MSDGPLSEIESCVEDAAEAIEDALQLIAARADAASPMMEALAFRLRGIVLALGDATSAEFRQGVEADGERIEGE